EELVKAREEIRLTPEQVAVKIKMDLKFLLKMESGDFSFLPDIFLKAFLREYAKCVGLNENAVMQKYKFAKEGKPLEEQPQEKETVKEVPPVPSSPKLITDDRLQNPYSPIKKFSFSTKQLIRIGVGALIVLSVLIYWFVIRQNADMIVTERPYEESIQENKARFEEDTVPADSSLAAASSDSLVLSISSKDSSWLKVNFDNGSTKEYFLFPNTMVEIKAAAKFSMTIGNPGAVKFILNNQPLEFKPASTRRAIIEITKGGITYLDQPQPQKQ
ncbi:MAG: RodZ domain-containing protein, partial [Ignavibacteriaceae bacterium]